MGGVIGVDEAGRGPVLGSMFVAGVSVPTESHLPEDVRDSKQLDGKRREALAAQLERLDAVHTSIVEVPPERIDDDPRGLNRLTARATGRVIDELFVEKEDRIVVDACDSDADRYAARVSAALDRDVQIIAEHHADETHPVVAAASIVAKQRREDHVASLREEYGEIGSGYPGDRTTRTYLADYVERHGKLPSCARASWQTSAEVLASRSQGTLDDFAARTD